MESIDYRYLRPKKAAALERMYQSPFPLRSQLSVWKGEKATIFPLRNVPELLFGHGGVVDAQGQFVELSAIPQRIWGGYPCDAPEYRDQRVVYCGYLVPQWGHFLVEGVARLWYFLEGDPTVDKYVFFLDEGEQREIRGNYREFLELLGIWDKLEFISQPTTYREVIVPELSFLGHTYHSRQYREIFDRVAGAVRPSPDWKPLEKIYYSRSQLKKGVQFEFGCEALDDFFLKNGYTVLYPEKVPLSQMIYYIRNAKTVATLSGSLQHNMLFAAQGQRVEILERCVLNVDFQVDVNRIRELEAVYIDANISLYTVDFCGPFIMGYTPHMARFAQDQGYVPPDPRFCSKAHYRKCFANYMRAYQDLYRMRWFMADWYTSCADYLWEAYQEGYAFFQSYMDGSEPYRLRQYFQFHYMKQFAKKVLGKLGLYHG